MNTLATSQKLKLSGLSSKHTEAIANNESIEIKRINKKIDVLDNKIEKLDNKVDEKFEKLDSNRHSKILLNRQKKSRKYVSYH